MKYSKQEIDEAVFSLTSTLNKCEKVIEKLKEGTPQHTLTFRRIKALKIALELLELHSLPKPKKK